MERAYNAANLHNATIIFGLYEVCSKKFSIIFGLHQVFQNKSSPPFHFGEWGIPLFTLVNFVEWGPPFALWLILVNGVPLILVTLGYIRGYIRGHNGVTLGLHSIT